MNIWSFLKSISLNPTTPTEPISSKPQDPKVTTMTKGLSAYSDSFEASPKIIDSLFSRVNYFSGKQLEAESLQAEQGYVRDRTESKTQYSEVFDPTTPYSSVSMQEGTAELDADYTEATSKNPDDDD